MSLLTTPFLGFTMPSPLLVASGPASHDVEQIDRAQEQGIGGIVLKTVVSDEFDHMRYWPRPRYKLLDWDKKMMGKSRYFTLYSYEQGFSGTVEEYLEFIRKAKERASVPIIASIFAGKAEDWAELAALVQQAGADALELDISSPHKPGTMEFETTFVAAIKAVLAKVSFPVLVKLNSNPDLVGQAQTAERLGAHAVTMCNRMRGLDIDIETRRPILHGYFAGFGGPWTKYYVYRHVAECAQVLKIPISATSGVICGDDALKYILLGATTVQILSVIMVNGWESIRRINDQMKAYLERKGVDNVQSLRGTSLQYLVPPEQIIRWPGHRWDVTVPITSEEAWKGEEEKGI